MKQMMRNGWLLPILLLAFRIELFSQTEVLFSRPGGFYEESFALSLGCSDGDCHICFTTNGNTPTINSTRYEAPLFLDASLYSDSDIYTIPIAPVFDSFVPDAVRHAIVIRAAAFDGNGQRVSEVVTQTYLIRSLGCNHHGLAVVSVCSDSLSLFDYDTGIFVPGRLFDAEDPDNTGNYLQQGREWERLANVEFYELDNTGINQQCGLRAHGNRARKAAAKGMKIYAREEYGKKRFKHRFFDTTSIQSFKRLVLKPYSTLWPCVGVQDYVANRLALRLGLEAPHSRPVVVYLNGEYWGIYFLQEKIDKHYLEDHFGVDPNECNIISGNGNDRSSGNWNLEVESGDGTGFGQMMDWLEDADFSDSTNYARLCDLVDIDNFVDYQILETFIANTDWPANNLRCWQVDGTKWRWAFFDGDASLLEKDYDVLGNACYVRNDRWYTGGTSTLLFRRLLENDDFKMRFWRSLDTLCNTALQYDSVNAYLNEVEQALRLEVPEEIARFGYPQSIDYWNWGVFLVRDFLNDRVDAYRQACDAFEPLKSHQYQLNTDDFVIYPNPTDDVVHIKMLDGRSRVTDFILCDAMGHVIVNGPCYLSACEEIVLGAELRSGLYVVRIGDFVHRFVKY